MNNFTVFFIAAVAITSMTQLWLAFRQKSSAMCNRDSVPSAFSPKISLASHQRAADYTAAKARIEITDIVVGAALLLFWTVGGGLEFLDGFWRDLAPLQNVPQIFTGAAVLISMFLVMGLLDLPFSIYRTFVIEARFGFNRSTPQLFFMDMLKQTMLLLLLGTPLILLVLWLINISGHRWWLYTWIFGMAFILALTWAYPNFIAPLFNKFSPLQDGALYDRIVKLLHRTGFTSNGIFVMDGSRRSSHGNAYFTGLGDSKRIVFYDTLLQKLPPEEIEAVLAHELGHFKNHHVNKRLGLMAISNLFGLILLAWLMNQDWFYTGLGVTNSTPYLALALFLMVLPVFTFFIHPFTTAMMRRHEFEADHFAARQVGAKPLINGLVKLYEENAATLTPDPWYSTFHDSHPPAPIRIAHLETYSSNDYRYG